MFWKARDLTSPKRIPVIVERALFLNGGQDLILEGSTTRLPQHRQQESYFSTTPHPQLSMTSPTEPLVRRDDSAAINQRRSSEGV
jgi:hypothetical protein